MFAHYKCLLCDVNNRTYGKVTVVFYLVSSHICRYDCNVCLDTYDCNVCVDTYDCNVCVDTYDCNVCVDTYDCNVCVDT